MEDTTIVALATPEGEGGLAVVRLSGPDALVIAHGLFRGRILGPEAESHRAVYGILFSSNDLKEDGYAIDEVLALPLRGPHSYTGEDTVEIFCHGGRMAARQIVAACRRAGCEPAAPGEFTRRAFLNGRLSLDQAEAVADLIGAENEAAAQAAVRQLLGGLDGQLRSIEDPLLGLLADIEGSLEFVDEEEVGVGTDEILAVLRSSVDRIEELLAMAPAGRLLRDGVHVVLAGAPNVGKSSLFNALLGEDRAIVDDEAGTTRDVVSARTVRDGTTFVFHDTAGLRDDPGRVEKMGIDRTWKKVGEADVVLLLGEAGGEAPPEPAGVAAPIIRVLTKTDRGPGRPPRPRDGTVATSAALGEGLDRLWKALDLAVAGYRLQEAVSLGVVLNERHLRRLERCRDDLGSLAAEITASHPGDEVVGTMLSSILQRLGEVSGRVFTEQLLESVFQRFCVGK
jgi:tRNA modification GTPase